MMSSSKIPRFLVIVPALIILACAILFSMNFSRQVDLARGSFRVQDKMNLFNQIYKNYHELVIQKGIFQTQPTTQNRTSFDSIDQVLKSQLETLYHDPILEQKFGAKLAEFREAYDQKLSQLKRQVGYFDLFSEDSAKIKIVAENKEVFQLSRRLEAEYQTLLTSLVQERTTLEAEYFSKVRSNYLGLILLFLLVIFLVLMNYYIGKKQQKIDNQKKFQQIELNLLQKDMLEFRTTFDFAAIGMALVNEQGIWIRVNPSLERMLGYTSEELGKMNFQQITHPDDLFSDLEQAKRLRNREIDSYTIQKRYFTKSGEILWTNLNGTAVWEADGTFRHFIAQIEDITNSKNVSIELEERERKFRSIFNSTFQFIGFLKPDGTVIEANETALGFADLDHEDVVGKKFWDCFWWQISVETQEKLQKSVERAANGEFIQYEVAVWNKEKKPVTILFNLKPVLGADGSVIAIIPEGRLIQDIVDARKSLELKNNELERFAAVASHDMKEPLRMVITFLGLLENRYKGQLDEKADQYIHFAVDASKRMNTLITELLEFSKIGTEETALEEINCNELVKNQVDFFSSTLSEAGGSLKYSSLPVITGKKVPLDLLFRNLIGNAIKYRKKDVPPEILVEVKERNDCWEFSISDNGIGFESEYAETIFGLFTRLHTREDYAGTGLGLSICKKIVEDHQGKIWAESRPQVGSVFHFTISKNLV